MSGSMPHDWREIDIETVERHMTKDMISRDAAIAAIRKQIGEGDEPWMKGNNSAIAACAATIRALPAYEVAVKPLEWRQIGDFGWIATDELCGVGVQIRDPDAYDAERAARIRSALTATPAADVTGRETAYQGYINEITPNGNSRMDNITICAGPNEHHQRHIAAQVDMAFQAGWSAALVRMKESKT